MTAIFISLMTLIIFIYQTRIIREQSRLSVTPRISFKTELMFQDSIASFSTIVENKGIGPGIIESIRIIYEGKVHQLNFRTFFDEAYPKLKSLGKLRHTSSLSEGSALAANESKVLFAYEYDVEKIPEIMGYLNVQEDDNLPFEIEIEYSSIYKEKWKVSTDDEGHPLRID